MSDAKIALLQSLCPLKHYADFSEIVGPTGPEKQILWRTGMKPWLSVLGLAGYFGLLVTLNMQDTLIIKRNDRKYSCVVLTEKYFLEKSDYTDMDFQKRIWHDTNIEDRPKNQTL